MDKPQSYGFLLNELIECVRLKSADLLGASDRFDGGRLRRGLGVSMHQKNFTMKIHVNGGHT